MKITVVPHDRLNLVQFQISTPAGEMTAETTSAYMNVDVPCDENRIGIKYRYLDNRHMPATDWIVKQEASWEPEPEPEVSLTPVLDLEPEIEPDMETFDK